MLVEYDCKKVNVINCEYKGETIEGHYYRYVLPLNIKTVSNKKILIMILMNPSKANKSESDITVNRVIKYAEEEKYSKLIVLNSLPYMETESEKLKKSADISKIGIENNLKCIKKIVKENDGAKIILAHGIPIGRQGAESLVRIYDILKKQECNVYTFGRNTVKPMAYPKHLRVTSNEELNNTREFLI